ncbi:MAG: glycosyltransferase family 2 protein [Planctomycetota bacterium]|nr:glycosyltransferase family 2 protein [Planctomycetota bacterium]
MSLLIVIINYRTPQVTIDCLASLAAQIDDVPGTRVILVDNASGDNSMPLLRATIDARGWSSWISLVESDNNRGFAGGNNFGLASVKDLSPAPRFVLLLNSDTIVQPGAIKHCKERMEAEPSIGILSCMLLNSDLTVQNIARKLPTPLRLAASSLGLPWFLPRFFGWANLEDESWDRRTQARDVDWVGGAFMMIRKDLIDRMGPMDDRFFFYGEDVEFCHRAWKNGMRVCYDPRATIIHLGGASSDSGRLASAQKNALMWQARYLIQRRCYGLVAEHFIRTIDIISFGLRHLKLLLRGRKNSPEYARQRAILAILLNRGNRS